MHLLLIVILGVLIANWLMTPSRGGNGCLCFIIVLFILWCIGHFSGGP